LKKLLTGLAVPQQYVCTPLETFSHPLSVFLTTQTAGYYVDVTATHVFLGYKPLCMLLPVEKLEEVCLNFVTGTFQPDSFWRGFLTDKRCVARLILKRGRTPFVENYYVYTGIYGAHVFLGKFHQFFNRTREQFQTRKDDNVGLPGNLHDQVRIAYAVPRIISLVIVASNDAMNMFPTDLHGAIGEDLYASSLRIGGKANHQVETIGKVVISQVPAVEFRSVYDLGKNHMQEMKGIGAFRISTNRSSVFSLPIPSVALRFLELKRVRSIDEGIHRIHLYEKVGQGDIASGETLSHVHQYYAQWRLDHGLPFKMLLR
jgi:hypothetical protein